MNRLDLPELSNSLTSHPRDPDPLRCTLLAKHTLGFNGVVLRRPAVAQRRRDRHGPAMTDMSVQ